MLPRKLDPSLRNHQFLVLHGMLPTRHSLRGDEAKKGCALCGNADADETMEHLFVGCPVTRGAIDVLKHSPDEKDKRAAKTLGRAKIGHYTFTSFDTKRRDVTTYVCFSRAVWRARWDCNGRTGEARLSWREVEDSITDQFRRARRRAAGGRWRTRDREAEADGFGEMLAVLPVAHHAYTDGSAFKCKDSGGLVETAGPTGCGAYVLTADGRDIYRSKRMDPGTNAQAEVCGILTATHMILEQDIEDDYPLYIFTDNRAAIKVATGAKTPWWCAEMAEELRTNMRKIAERRKVVCFWVPGHGGVKGNELADRLARRGATGTTSRDSVTEGDSFNIPAEDLISENVLMPKRRVPRPIDIAALLARGAKTLPYRTMTTDTEQRYAGMGGGRGDGRPHLKALKANYFQYSVAILAPKSSSFTCFASIKHN